MRHLTGASGPAHPSYGSSSPRPNGPTYVPGRICVANFLELRIGEVRRIPLKRTSENPQKAKFALKEFYEVRLSIFSEVHLRDPAQPRSATVRGLALQGHHLHPLIGPGVSRPGLASGASPPLGSSSIKAAAS